MYVYRTCRKVKCPKCTKCYGRYYTLDILCMHPVQFCAFQQTHKTSQSNNYNFLVQNVLFDTSFVCLQIQNNKNIVEILIKTKHHDFSQFY